MIALTQVTVTNPSGLHARPATELVRLVSSLSSTTQLVVGKKTVNAASVLSVMAAAVQCGQTVTVRCDGDDAEQDLAVLVDAIQGGLGE